MDKNSIIRIGILVIALINQLLTAAGKSPIPIDSETWEQFVSAGFTIVAAAIAGYKNNYLTQKGKMQKDTLKRAGLTKAK